MKLSIELKIDNENDFRDICTAIEMLEAIKAKYRDRAKEAWINSDIQQAIFIAQCAEERHKQEESVKRAEERNKQEGISPEDLAKFGEVNIGYVNPDQYKQSVFGRIKGAFYPMASRSENKGAMDELRRTMDITSPDCFFGSKK